MPASEVGSSLPGHTATHRRPRGVPLRPVAFAAVLACTQSAIAADKPIRPDILAVRAQHPGLAAQIDSPAYREAIPNLPRRPHARWTVHDFARPQPPIVTPPAAACAEPLAAPSDAIDLLAGGLKDWTGERIADWTFAGGILQSGGKALNMIATRAAFGDIQLHIRFRTPDGPDKPYGQHRGNSGVLFMGLYELQILDSFDNPTYPDGMAAAIYGQTPPRANAARPPGQWQCYDAVFRAPRFSGGKLRSPARITVFWNGVLVQDAQPIFGPTAAAAILPYKPHAAQAPLLLQDHGDPTGRVAFSSLWVRRLKPEPK